MLIISLSSEVGDVIPSGVMKFISTNESHSNYCNEYPYAYNFNSGRLKRRFSYS